MRRASGVAALTALVALSACAPRAFVRPSGASTPAPEAARIWDGVLSRCRDITGYTGRLGVTGRVADRRIPLLASTALYVGVTTSGLVAVEARVSGQLAFKLAGTAAESTLILREDNQVVTSRADEIVEALVGLRAGPDGLLAALTGCPSRSATIARSLRYGDILEIVTSDATVFLREQRGTWQLRSADVAGIVVDYERVKDGVPETLVLRSPAGRKPDVALRLRVEERRINPDLAPEVFQVTVPPGAAVRTLEDLRAAGPLGAEDASAP